MNLHCITDPYGWLLGASLASSAPSTTSPAKRHWSGHLAPPQERPGAELPDWQEEHNASHRNVRASAEHVFTWTKGCKILRECRRPP
ncbi:hypothetical protein [Streptomyces ossamyceticus]|uniref:hypothetical protein n=1 Tax=Streptomyces ossamyceticus TaxID=249581 RepID=UPI0039C8E10C